MDKTLINDYEGIPTGFSDFDTLTGGLCSSQLIIITGRTCVGKTSFVLNVARNIGVEQNSTIMVISLEMRSEDVSMMMLSAASQVPLFQLHRGHIKDDDWPPLAIGADQFWNAPIFIETGPSISNLSSICKSVRQLKIQHPTLSAVIVDYIQRINVTERHDNRILEISEIVRTLKELACELEIPVIACSQLRSDKSFHENKRPVLTDLQASKTLEKAADIIVFLHRDDYDEHDWDNNDPVEVQLLISKPPRAPLKEITLLLHEKQRRFENINP